MVRRYVLFLKSRNDFLAEVETDGRVSFSVYRIYAVVYTG